MCFDGNPLALKGLNSRKTTEGRHQRVVKSGAPGPTIAKEITNDNLVFPDKLLLVVEIRHPAPDGF
jgi:hypothetical protein